MHAAARTDPVFPGMRTLHRYLLRQVFAAFLMAVVIFTFVLLLNEVIKEILARLVTNAITPVQTLEAFALLLPYVLSYSFPMSILAAIMLVLGRFSADQELTAVRAGGISLLTLVSPVLTLSVVLSLVCGVFNLEIAPRSRLAYKTFLVQVGFDRPAALLTEGVFMDYFTNHIIYIGQINGEKLQEVQIYQLNAAGQVESHFHAPTGNFEIDEASSTNKILNLHLFQLRGAQLREDRWIPMMMAEAHPSMEIKPPSKNKRDPKISELTFRELREKLAEVDRRGLDTTPILVHLHRQIANSFACLSFALIGIPLSIRAHRRETSISIVFALLLSLIYYSFITVSQMLATRAEWAPHLIVWLPNFLFQITGAILLRKVNRGV